MIVQLSILGPEGGGTNFFVCYRKKEEVEDDIITKTNTNTHKIQITDINF